MVIISRSQILALWVRTSGSKVFGFISGDHITLEYDYKNFVTLGLGRKPKEVFIISVREPI